MAAGRWKSALGGLLGLLLFCSVSDDWLADNEVHASDWGKFAGFFARLSEAWVAVLARTDEELGLALPVGRAGGYRAQLQEMLRAWEEETNESLDELYNSSLEPGKPRARVAAVGAA